MLILAPLDKIGMSGQGKDWIRAGLDVGSTTAKIVLVDEQGKIIYSAYKRHHADVLGTAATLFSEVMERFGDLRIRLTVTGSAGMGIAERFLLPFEQEVVSATNLIRTVYPEIKTLIDIGGEDAKMVFFREGALPDMRMSGNCAGGTGAFIDQMATLLGCSVDEMGQLAMQPGTKIHPIASRCGVFSKTDIQNLIARNVSKADVSVSVFHAVAVQTITTLSHGFQVQPKVLFCGGPFAFTPALREAFVRYIGLRDEEYIVPENAPVISAWGAALSPSKADQSLSLSDFIGSLRRGDQNGNLVQTHRLEPLFRDAAELRAWEDSKKETCIPRVPMAECDGTCFLGIDSGSTTTKIVAIDRELVTQEIARNPSLALAMMKYLARTVRMLSDQVDQMAFRPAQWRLARYLLVRGEQDGRVPCTQEEIAASISVSRVTVSRLLSQLARENVVELGYRCLIIRDRKALEALCPT